MNRKIGYRIGLAIGLLSGFLTPGHGQEDPLFTRKSVFGSLAERWELDSASRKSTFRVTPYKPLNITGGRWSNRPNEQPVSENPMYSLPFQVDYGNYEAKYQISMKIKVVRGLLGKRGDVWIGYTQKSHWQIYNTRFSRPFRETNYEPEVILNFATNFPVLGLRNRMLGISFNHQSNGRSLPLSRSWNRVIAHAGLERGNWTLMLRGWYRLPDADDENPAITDNIGRADALLVFHTNRHLFAVLGSHSLRGGNRNRGQVQFDWTYPVWGNLRGHFQVLNGYGETLVDYNHFQTTIGFGISLVEWL
ncbi:phospholipase A [Spirosoma sordidisoli]|uniref:Phosphatidylcholine 1-acylhydrolase n=1 Tax=Spirosoma sordidisoli TaxID=2502893 RepID=A0A4Q2UNA7_9BACT|nr:phospholipase A [Spirosoma sordidisoli]RYC69070.1 phospholipase [Spirosoma sordidisoli]